MLNIEKLSKSYDQNNVLEEISLHFSQGKVYGLVGENGAGKTTLFRCIAGLEPYDGQIHCEEVPLKNHLGLLMTDPYFPAKLTGKEYITLLCEARNIRMELNDDMNIFDLPLNQYASTYSTGMKKKLAITAILQQQNKIFILDEPYNGLDIESNILLNELIIKLRNANKLIILSSHIFSSLKDVCDNILFMKKGEGIKTYGKEEFNSLERTMKTLVISEKVNRFQVI